MPNPLNAISGPIEGDLEGRVLVVKADRIAPEYQDQDRRWLAVGGSGCHPGSLGTSVFATSLLDGEEARLHRWDFEGFAANAK